MDIETCTCTLIFDPMLGVHHVAPRNVHCKVHGLSEEVLCDSPGVRAAEQLASDVWSSTSGAKSSGRVPPYHLIPWHVFADRLAERYRLGAEKYPESDGAPNWTKGLRDKPYCLDRANHMLAHAHDAVEEMCSGKSSSDDNLAAAMWGLIFLMAAQQETSK